MSYQSIFRGLNTGEKKRIKALAPEPTTQPYAGWFLAKYGLSLGGVQKSIKSLIKKDLIELYNNELYRKPMSCLRNGAVPPEIFLEI